MWRKATCRCSSVDNVFTPVSMKNKTKKKSRSKKKRDVQEKPSVFDPPNPYPLGVSYPIIPLGEDEEEEDELTKQACFVADATDAAGSTSAVVENDKFSEVEDGHKKHACSVGHIKAAAADATAEAAKQVVQMTTVTVFAGKSEEEVAAVRIQTVIRCYLARRALQSLKGHVRLKSHVCGASVKQHTSDAMRYMQTRSQVLEQVRSRRVGLSQENQAVQRQLLRAKQLKNLKAGDEWDISLLSKGRIEANLLEKYEAAVRRERSLAYSYALQLSNMEQQTQNQSTKSTRLWSADHNNPILGWIWFDRWMTTTHPWEIQTKDHNSNHSGSLRIPAREVTKCSACRLLNPDNLSSSATQKLHIHHSPRTVCSKAAAASSSFARTVKSSSLNGSIVSQGNDSRNARSMAGSLSREDGNLTSPPSFPSYMAPTHSAMLKLKLTSPESNVMMPEKDSTMSAKKRLSYPPARNRRHLGHTDTRSVVEENNANGMCSSSFASSRGAAEG